MDITVFFEDVDLLRLIVVVEDKIVTPQIRHEFAAITLHRHENIDEIDVNLKSLLGQVNHRRRQQDNC